MSFLSETRCMNPPATSEPFTNAMSRARVMAERVGRCRVQAATVKPVRTRRERNTNRAARTWRSMSTWSWAAARSWASSMAPLLEQIEDREQEDPDEVDEVPEEP